MNEQGHIIQQLIDAGVRDQVKVMIGGAPVTQMWADRIGADAFTTDAAEELGFSVDNTKDFEDHIKLRAGKKFNFTRNQQKLFDNLTTNPDAPIYFIQSTETQKNNEFLIVFSHICHVDSTNILKSLADEADVFYYSPTKNYTLFYTLDFLTDSVRTKSININHGNPHHKVTHVHLQEKGLSPFNFNISNMITPSSDTLWLP